MIKRYCDKCGDCIKPEGKYNPYGNRVIGNVLGGGEFCEKHFKEGCALYEEFEEKEADLLRKYQELWKEKMKRTDEFFKEKEK